MEEGKTALRTAKKLAGSKLSPPLPMGQPSVATPSDARGSDTEALRHVRERIRTLVGIAAANESTMSADELRVLLPRERFGDADAVVRFIEEDYALRDELVVNDGEVAPRADTALVARRRDQRTLTRDRVALARGFAASLVRFSPWTELVAVSGSVAYGGTKLDDDIDFFVVTPRRRLWITLLIALGLARLNRARHPRAPVFCFNRLEETERCESGFREAREPLFAREALNLRILHGSEFYHDLLAASPWMETWFPSLYRMRLDESAREPGAERDPRGTQWAAANALAFLVLGPYLWIVGALRNSRLRREGRNAARFRTVIEPGFCAYESQKYDDLGDAYRRTFT
ncbi:MAG TPA: hypothetical protein VEY12_12220 [Thermoplasmata archaeon]|nr:hypothetical protein [Thermoplasmata archaeon]